MNVRSSITIEMPELHAYKIIQGWVSLLLCISWWAFADLPADAWSPWIGYDTSIIYVRYYIFIQFILSSDRINCVYLPPYPTTHGSYSTHMPLSHIQTSSPRPQSGDPSPTWVLIPRFSPLRGIARLAGGSAPVFIGSNFICPAACQTELSMLVNYYPKHSPQTARIDLIRSGLCICYPWNNP